MSNFAKLAAGAIIAASAASTAMADLYFPSLSYRTGAYGAGGGPYADGYMDYFNLLNERDGGLGGVRAVVEECETAYDTQKGVECYEATKGNNPMVYNPLSTGITYQLIPKVQADDLNLYTPGYGRTSAANGQVFENVFNFPANYWNGASAIINHLLEINGGSLEGKKIALVYHNSAYGKEPIGTLEALSEKHGFDLSLLPVDHPGQEQKSQWLQVRRDRPDNVILYGWGVMNPVALQEAANIRYPMDQVLGIWWSGNEIDVEPVGAGADGYKSANFHAPGSDFPVFDEVREYLVDTGKAASDGQNIGTVPYNKGFYAAMLMAESALKAQEIHGTPDITPQQFRDGMEALEMTEARMEELGMPGFGPEFSVSCENHGGPGRVAIQQYDAEADEFTLITDFIESDMEVIQPLIDQDSEAFASESGIEPRDCG
ncbi:ABC transporter substrate-binding protein [Paracoccaceae bacterium GXU_MW_L88]